MTSPVTPPNPDDRDPVTSDSPTQELRACPTCGRPTGVGRYCENCGADMTRPTPPATAGDAMAGDAMAGDAMAGDAMTDGVAAGGAGADVAGVVDPAAARVGGGPVAGDGTTDAVAAESDGASHPTEGLPIGGEDATTSAAADSAAAREGETPTVAGVPSGVPSDARSDADGTQAAASGTRTASGTGATAVTPDSFERVTSSLGAVPVAPSTPAATDDPTPTSPLPPAVGEDGLGGPDGSGVDVTGRTEVGVPPVSAPADPALDAALDPAVDPGLAPPLDPPQAARPAAGMLVLGGLPPEQAAPTPPAPVDDGPRCACGGTFTDGYCDQCGSPLPVPRAHTEDAPAPWVAGVCDIGVRHQSNQDAMALSADGSRAALVVCDGVSSALRSEDASQAAADAALAVLTRATSTGIGVPSSVVPALVARLETAEDAAADAVADVTAEVHRELGIEDGRDGESFHANPSCTFVAAIVEAGHVVLGSVGDSRAYWFPDSGAAERLTVDDSWAEEQIALGATREQAESGPGAHTITRWLGIDCDDHTPRTTSFPVTAPGWLVLCSDGLWNYASEPATLAEVVAEVERGLAEADPGTTVTPGATSPIAEPVPAPESQGTSRAEDVAPAENATPGVTGNDAPVVTGNDAPGAATLRGDGTLPPTPAPVPAPSGEPQATAPTPDLEARLQGTPLEESTQVTTPVADPTHLPASDAPGDRDDAPAPTTLATGGADPLPGRADPLGLARGLVQWANARGGHDNITVIAARLTPDAPTQEA